MNTDYLIFKLLYKKMTVEQHIFLNAHYNISYNIAEVMTSYQNILCLVHIFNNYSSVINRLSRKASKEFSKHA